MMRILIAALCLASALAGTRLGAERQPRRHHHPPFDQYNYQADRPDADNVMVSLLKGSCGP